MTKMPAFSCHIHEELPRAQAPQSKHFGFHLAGRQQRPSSSVMPTYKGALSTAYSNACTRMSRSARELPYQTAQVSGVACNEQLLHGLSKSRSATAVPCQRPGPNVGSGASASNIWSHTALFSLLFRGVTHNPPARVIYVVHKGQQTVGFQGVCPLAISAVSWPPLGPAVHSIACAAFSSVRVAHGQS